MSNNYPQTVSDYFPSKWLKPDDLNDKPVTISIKALLWEEVYDIRERSHVTKLIIAFAGATKRLIPNKTQCEAIWAATQSEKFADWVGKAVILTPGIAPNRKPTIIISAAPIETQGK